jgi:hypothetical protein
MFYNYVHKSNLLFFDLKIIVQIIEKIIFNSRIVRRRVSGIIGNTDSGLEPYNSKEGNNNSHNLSDKYNNYYSDII